MAKIISFTNQKGGVGKSTLLYPTGLLFDTTKETKSVDLGYE